MQVAREADKVAQVVTPIFERTDGHLQTAPSVIGENKGWPVTARIGLGEIAAVDYVNAHCPEEVPRYVD